LFLGVVKTKQFGYSTSERILMSKLQENGRVLSRLGARELTEKEMEQVSGGFTFLPRCTFDPVTCAMDGVCSPPPAC
jgi:bacteriocin-like protein